MGRSHDHIYRAVPGAGLAVCALRSNDRIHATAGTADVVLRAQAQGGLMASKGEPKRRQPEEPVYDAVRDQLEVDPEEIAARPRWEIPARLDREWHERRGQ